MKVCVVEYFVNFDEKLDGYHICLYDAHDPSRLYLDVAYPAQVWTTRSTLKKGEDKENFARRIVVEECGEGMLKYFAIEGCVFE